VARGANQGGFHHIDLNEALNMFMRDFGGMGGFESLFGGGRRRPRRAGARTFGSPSSSGCSDVAAGSKRTIKLRNPGALRDLRRNGAAEGTKP
jgi:molecular chaperone DnaJ